MDENKNQAIDVASQDAYEILLEKMQDAKRDFLLRSLKQKGIEIPETNRTLEDIEEIIKKQKPEIRGEMQDAEKEFEESVARTVEELKKGSTNAMTRFLSDLGKRSLEVGKKLAVGAAGVSAVALMPTTKSKAITGTVLLGAGIYKASQDSIVKNRRRQNISYNLLLQELEVTRDEKGNLVETQFSPDIQEQICNYLESRNIDVNRNEYEDVREKLYGTSLKNKRELINIINAYRGTPIDVDKRLEKVERNLGTRTKENYIAPMLAAIVGGTEVADIVNKINPGIISAPVNAIIGGEVVKKVTNNQILGNIAAGGAGILSAVGSFIPVAKEILEVENVAVCGTVGAAVGLASVVGKNAISSIKANNEAKKFDEVEAEIKTTRGENETISQTDTTILEIVKNYMSSKGMEVSDEVRTVEQLKEIASTATNEQKKDITSLLNILARASKEKTRAVDDKLKELNIRTKLANMFGVPSEGCFDISEEGVITGIMQSPGKRKEKIKVHDELTMEPGLA